MSMLSLLADLIADSGIFVVFGKAWASNNDVKLIV